MNNAVRDLLDADLSTLAREAERLRDTGHGRTLSYSRKVFIPLTQLCRDVCHYCTFSRPPKAERRAYLGIDEVLGIARAGEAAGCHEALFTLGDKPEARWDIARTELAKLGFASTIDYLHHACAQVLEHTTLLPHVNPGVMTRAEMVRLREVSVSMGMMLESTSARLLDPGQAHHGSPDKEPALRLQTIETAGELSIPFTSGLLIGIGETREERIETLLALRESHRRHGHLQEIIVQNFRAKAGTPMALAKEPSFDDLRWTIAVARLLFGPEMNIQAPPNLSPANYRELVAAGINDWGGISPVTKDHVNPEAQWPQIAELGGQSSAAGKRLAERLAIYPRYAQDVVRWVAPELAGKVMREVDARGWPREGAWICGSTAGTASDFAPPAADGGAPRGDGDRRVGHLIERCHRGERLSIDDVTALFEATGAAQRLVLDSADELRRATVGNTVRYVVNRNINYTNVCTFKCGFCAFSKGRHAEHLRGKSYDLDEAEIRRRVAEAWERGATEVCMQGGIHPDYDGSTYLAIVRMVKAEQPAMHVHAFSPLEITHGAETTRLPLGEYLAALKHEGLSTLPGTAAEILDDEIRARICPGKLTASQWLAVMRAAHGVGIRSTATIMFGHVEAPVHWARHLLAIRDLQVETGGFTELVPLPFIPAEAPMYRRGEARRGPTAREAMLMYAVARLVLHPHLPNIQASWVKLGPEGTRASLAAGANDLGGTLMNESISRAAGGSHGQELGPHAMEALITSAGRKPQQRTTLYGEPPAQQRERSFAAPPLAPVVLPPVVFARSRGARSLPRSL